MYLLTNMTRFTFQSPLPCSGSVQLCHASFLHNKLVSVFRKSRSMFMHSQCIHRPVSITRNPIAPCATRPLSPFPTLPSILVVSSPFYSSLLSLTASALVVLSSPTCLLSPTTTSSGTTSPSALEC